MKTTSTLFRITLLFVFISGFSFAENRYWVAGGDGNWKSISNWSNLSGGSNGFSVPSNNDTVFFDGNGNLNCAIDTNVSVAGIVVDAFYNSIIRLNAGSSITVGAYGYTQTGGTFTADNGAITLNGAFTLNGGKFYSTSGTLAVNAGFTNGGGIFYPENGTVLFSNNQTITGNTTFYDLVFNANGAVYTVASGTTITSQNNVTIAGTLSCTINKGVVEIKGNLTLNSSSNNSINGGSATFLFNGSGTQNINSAFSSISLGVNERKCALPNVEINKTTGSLNLSGVINLNGATWTTTAGGALINAGTSTVNIISSITFSGENFSLYTLHIWSNGQTIALSPSPYLITVTREVIINGGGSYQVNSGTVEIQGDLTLINTGTSLFNGGTGTFLFDGSGTQSINSSAPSTGYVCALPRVQINKTSGSLNLSGIINFSGSCWNTIAGASLVNAGTSTVNLLKTTSLLGQNLSLYNLVISGNSSITTIGAAVTWTSTHLLTFNGGANYYQINNGTLNAKGDILISNTNTSANVGGTATLLIDGAANQTLTGSGVAGGGRLPKVVIDKSGGKLTLSGVISVDNNWTYVDGTVDAKTNASTVDFYKTAVLDAQGTSLNMSFYNLTLSGLITLGGNLDVDGNFTIRTGVNNRLDVSAAGNYQINVAGNWINNNSVTSTSFNQQSGKIIFDGSSAQSLTLSLATDTESFYNLEISNSNGGLLLNAPIVVSNNLNFVSGIINSSASKAVLLTNTASTSGANATSFISGPIYKSGNTPFTFPIGKNGLFAPVAISATALSSNQFKAEYFQANPGAITNENSKDLTLDHISTCEYWVIDRTAGSADVAVTLSWDSRSCGVTNASDLRVANWDGTTWKDLGNVGITGTASSGTILSSASLLPSQPITLASNTSGNPLPIQLIRFVATPMAQGIELNWSTATENNNAYFTLQRSKEAQGWEMIGALDGAGNSNLQQDYIFIDKNPIEGLAYYRLKQTDYNGNCTYSEVISVKSNSLEAALTIYPNPMQSGDKLGFSVLGFEDGKVLHLLVCNALGIELFEQGINFENNESKNEIEWSQRLMPGTYMLVFKTTKGVYTRKLIVE